MYEAVAHKLVTGEVVILDGGTGTAIQAQGVPMDDAVWCAMANLTHADAVQAVHEAYIEAGADVITANTYASSPILFDALGRLDEIAAIDRAAIRAARMAVTTTAEKPVAVAGSFSVMRVVESGGDRTIAPAISPKRAAELMERKAEGLAESGCDLIIMEMMRDCDLSLLATEAAVETGLPVWVGIAVERREDGRLAGFDVPEWTLEDITSALMATGAAVCCVMHNEISLTSEALKTIQRVWAGPIGAYPENGVFKMPNWEFGEITPAEFVRNCKEWRNIGAGVLGGCCGIGPEHIAALSAAFAKPPAMS
jgi:homocysteine S-methyltransferase